MLKTQIDIERDFYSLVLNSTLGEALQGRVYRSEMRPYGDTSECAVVRLIAGAAEQVQEGVVSVNIYVPDIAYGSKGQKVANAERICTLQRLALDLIEEGGDGEYDLEADGLPTTMMNDEIKQHFIYCRIKFKRLS